MKLRYTRIPLASWVGWPLMLPMLVFWSTPRAPLAIRLIYTVVPVGLVLWRNGATIDLGRRTVLAWWGPQFPLVWRRHALERFTTVSVMEQGETHHSHAGGKSYLSTVMLKLQAPAAGWDPHDPDSEPPVVSLRNFPCSERGRQRALEEGRALAKQLALTFRSDIAETGAVPPSVDRAGP